MNAEDKGAYFSWVLGSVIFLLVPFGVYIFSSLDTIDSFIIISLFSIFFINFLYKVRIDFIWLFLMISLLMTNPTLDDFYNSYNGICNKECMEVSDVQRKNLVILSVYKVASTEYQSEYNYQYIGILGGVYHKREFTGHSIASELGARFGTFISMVVTIFRDFKFS